MITRRKCVLIGLDAVLLTTAYLTAFWLRLGWDWTAQNAGTVAKTLPFLLGVSLLVHLRHGLFNAILRYASLETAIAVLKSVAWSVTISCLVIFLLFRLEGVPRSVFAIYGMTALLLIGAARLAVRVRCDRHDRHQECSDHAPIVLYGAGDTAEFVLRGLRTSPDLEYRVVGLIDECPTNRGREIRGVRIYGGLATLDEIVRTNTVEELWVCVADLAGEELRAIYDAATSHSIRTKILPKLRHSLLGQDLGRFQEPDIADLLRRSPRSLDRQSMEDWVANRRVLITGAGGSIGQELSRQVAKLGPSALALCDACEANLFDIHGQLNRRFSSGVARPFLVDIRDATGVTGMFGDVRPDIVLHAAAYKHVPLVELNPCEGVLTNVHGLCNVALAASEFGVEQFVFISTDKAVRPTNVMGATKRLGEKIIQALDGEESTKFSAVRFGNVLGSSGSVVPIFKRQIRDGGPVTVTHPEMTRYFMLVSEAAQLVIQAGCIGDGGEVFILDMGESVRIADMARDLIRLMGKDGEIDIVYSGTRPGEKIHEELLIDTRDSRTEHRDIWIEGQRRSQRDWVSLRDELRELFRAAGEGRRHTTLRVLADLVEEFEPGFEVTRAAIEAPRPEPVASEAAPRFRVMAAAAEENREAVRQGV